MIKSYKELSLKKFDEISAILNSDKDDVDKDVDILSVLSGYSVEEIRDMDIDAVNGMLNDAKFLSVPMEEMSVGKSIRYKGTEYVVSKDMTYGQYIDFEKCTDMTSVLGVLLVPKGHKYMDGYEVDFSDINAVEGISIVNFFIHGLRDSAMRTLRYFQSLLVFRPKYRHLISSARSLLQSIRISLF